MKRLAVTALFLMGLPLAAPQLMAEPQAKPATAPAQAKPATPAAQAKPTSKAAGRVIEITGNDEMKFSVNEITAKPGELITIRLKNVGTLPKVAMGHNVVVLKADADPVAFTNAAATARETDFVPPAQKDKVVAHTTLTGPGETAEVTFKAPAAGTYPYLCSFPGHYAAGMRGKLIVK